MRILFVEQFYYPDGWGGAELPLDLTMHLARSGYSVEVICGSDPYAPVEGAPPPDPRGCGVRIRRIPAIFSGDVHRFKLLRQLWFYAALLPLLLLRRPPHLIVAQTNPPLAVVLAAAAARLWGTGMVIIAMDIYPEVLVAHGTLRNHRAVRGVLTALFRWAYRSALRVVSLGPIMSQRLAAKGVDVARIVEIPNWATGALEASTNTQNALRIEWNLEGTFVLLYSGNTGVAHEFDTLLRAVQIAHRTVPALRLVFIGRGARLADIKRRVAELGIESIVRFNDLLPAGRLPESFGLAQLAVVTLQPGFEGLVVPSKLQGYMARGVPVMYIGPPSDIDCFIEASAAGISLRNGDAAGAAAAIESLAVDGRQLGEYARRARKFYDDEFAKPRGLERYGSLVREMLCPGDEAP